MFEEIRKLKNTFTKIIILYDDKFWPLSDDYMSDVSIKPRHLAENLLM